MPAWIWSPRRKNWIGCCGSAVREHLVADVPLGVWASGGLDSSTILHYAAGTCHAAAEDIFGIFRRAQFRRERVLPRDARAITGPTITNSI